MKSYKSSKQKRTYAVVMFTIQILNSYTNAAYIWEVSKCDKPHYQISSEPLKEIGRLTTSVGNSRAAQLCSWETGL